MVRSLSVVPSFSSRRHPVQVNLEPNSDDEDRNSGGGSINQGGAPAHMDEIGPSRNKEEDALENDQDFDTAHEDIIILKQENKRMKAELVDYVRKNKQVELVKCKIENENLKQELEQFGKYYKSPLIINREETRQSKEEKEEGSLNQRDKRKRKKIVSDSVIEDAQPLRKQHNKEAKINWSCSVKNIPTLQELCKKSENQSTVIWKADPINLMDKDVVELAQGKEMEAAYIDAIMHIFQREHDKERVAKKLEATFTLSANCMTYLNNNYQGCLRECIVDPFQKICKGNKYRYVLIPIHSFSEQENGHWSLLMYDTRLMVSKHFNSMIPPKNTISLGTLANINAEKMHEYIINNCIILNSELKKKTALCKVQHMLSPQQTGGTDCGIFVCRFARDIYTKGKVPEKYMNKEGEKFRNYLVDKILQDENRVQEELE